MIRDVGRQIVAASSSSLPPTDSPSVVHSHRNQLPQAVQQFPASPQRRSTLSPELDLKPRFRYTIGNAISVAR